MSWASGCAAGCASSPPAGPARRARPRGRLARRRADRVDLPRLRGLAGRASTRCGSAGSRRRGCSGRPQPGSTPAASSTPTRATCRPSTGCRSTVVGRGAGPGRRPRRAPGLGPGRPRAAPERRGRVAGIGRFTGRAVAGVREASTNRASEARSRSLRTRSALLPLVEAFRAAQGARRKPSTSATRWPWRPGSRGSIPAWGGWSGTATTWCCSMNTRTPAPPSGCCCRRCSAAATRSPRSATRCQSIYGWRGASAGNLDPVHPRVPGGAPRPGTPTQVVDLTTSFRNSGAHPRRRQRVVGAAARPGVPVRDLVPGPKGPRSGRVVHACTVRRRGGGGVDRGPGSGVCSARRAVWRPQMVAVLARGPLAVRAGIERALRARGVPVEVSGLGGLLSTPEVTDVVATVRAMSDPAAGNAVLRLLTGARWRIGARDLAALAGRARALARPAPDVVAALAARFRRPGGRGRRRRRKPRRGARRPGSAQRLLGRGLPPDGTAAPGAARSAAALEPAAARPDRRRDPDDRRSTSRWRRTPGARPVPRARPPRPRSSTWPRSSPRPRTLRRRQPSWPISRPRASTSGAWSSAASGSQGTRSSC